MSTQAPKQPMSLSEKRAKEKAKKDLRKAEKKIKEERYHWDDIFDLTNQVRGLSEMITTTLTEIIKFAQDNQNKTLMTSANELAKKALTNFKSFLETEKLAEGKSGLVQIEDFALFDNVFQRLLNVHLGEVEDVLGAVQDMHNEIEVISKKENGEPVNEALLDNIEIVEEEDDVDLDVQKLSLGQVSSDEE